METTRKLMCTAMAGAMVWVTLSGRAQARILPDAHGLATGPYALRLVQQSLTLDLAGPMGSGGDASPAFGTAAVACGSAGVIVGVAATAMVIAIAVAIGSIRASIL